MEVRKALSKEVDSLVLKAKEVVRVQRQHGRSDLKKKEQGMPTEDKDRFMKELEQLTKYFNDSIDQLAAKKQNEIRRT